MVCVLWCIKHYLRSTTVMVMMMMTTTIIDHQPSAHHRSIINHRILSQSPNRHLSPVDFITICEGSRGLRALIQCKEATGTFGIVLQRRLVSSAGHVHVQLTSHCYSTHVTLILHLRQDHITFASRKSVDDIEIYNLTILCVLLSNNNTSSILLLLWLWW